MSTALISPIVPTEDQEKVNAIFDGIEATLVFIPDGLRIYSVSPPLLEAFMANISYFMTHPRLSQELLATIRYLVSTSAKCSFCIDFNQAILINLGKNIDDLTAAQQNPDKAPLSQSEKVLLKIALKAIDDPENVAQTDILLALEHGLSERDVFDAVVIAANNRAFTYVLRTFKIEQQGTFA